MAGISIANLRVGKKYFLMNFGDRYEFKVLRNINGSDFRVRDLISMENYKISDLIFFGRGNDFEIRELE